MDVKGMDAYARPSVLHNQSIIRNRLHRGIIRRQIIISHIMHKITEQVQVRRQLRRRVCRLGTFLYCSNTWINGVWRSLGGAPRPQTVYSSRAWNNTRCVPRWADGRLYMRMRMGMSMSIFIASQDSKRLLHDEERRETDKNTESARIMIWVLIMSHRNWSCIMMMILHASSPKKTRTR